MKRHELEHVLRACAGITGKDRFIVVGSQAVLGQFPDAPEELLVSREADLYCPDDPAATDLIDGSIGELSPFDQTFRYYAHGVGAETAVLPSGWEQRLVPLQTEMTGGATGCCLEVHDLAVSKLVAGREKDLRFVSALIRHRLADPATVRERLSLTALPEERMAVCQSRLSRVTRESDSSSPEPCR
jgi:hypothetical protein